MNECPVCGAPISVEGLPDCTDFNGDYILAEWHITCDCGACLIAQSTYTWDENIDISEE